MPSNHSAMLVLISTSSRIGFIAFVLTAFSAGCGKHTEPQHQPSFPFNASQNTQTSRPGQETSHAADRGLAQEKARIASAAATRNNIRIKSSEGFRSEIKLEGGLESLLQKRMQSLSSRLQEIERTNPSSAELPKLRTSVALLKSVKLHKNICQKGPVLFSSDVSNAVEGNFATGLNYAEPYAQLALVGCGFGSITGSVTLELSTGQSFPVAVASSAGGSWDDRVVTGYVPWITGVPDQPAKLVLTTNTSQVASLPVTFVAYRDTERLDSDTHRNLITVNAECFTATTDDSCGGGSVGDPRWPDGRTYVGAHWKECCKGHNGTDIYSVSLNNHWTIPALDPYVGSPQSDFPDDGDYEWNDGGYTTCWWFGNQPGHYVGESYSPGGGGNVTFQMALSWHVDGVCSGYHYNENQLIVGPIGLPYW